MALFNTLTSYPWDTKLYPTNPLAKSVAHLKQLPNIVERADSLKPKFEEVSSIINAMLDVTKCIVEFKDLLPQYITADTPEIITATPAIVFSPLNVSRYKSSARFSVNMRKVDYINYQVNRETVITSKMQARVLDAISFFTNVVLSCPLRFNTHFTQSILSSSFPSAPSFLGCSWAKASVISAMDSLTIVLVASITSIINGVCSSHLPFKQWLLTNTDDHGEGRTLLSDGNDFLATIWHVLLGRQNYMGAGMHINLGAILDFHLDPINGTLGYYKPNADGACMIRELFLAIIWTRSMVVGSPPLWDAINSMPMEHV
ncbi:hypothetical protein LguiB_004299 [Lonicera macranthoides]